MLEARQIIREAARVDVTVLVTGETGTGKELVARAIHQRSRRSGKPFVVLDCAAIPPALVESELFGTAGRHRRSQAQDRQPRGGHGTMFWTRLRPAPALQAKLLHVLQTRVREWQVHPSVDVRVLAATNQDLERAMTEGKFREDLYYRLAVVAIRLPALRERVTEIPMLVNYFVERYSKLYRRDGFVVPGAVMERLARHRYPGNVRELENLVKRMIVLDDPYLTRIPLPDPTAGGSPQLSPASEQLEPSLKEISRRASQAAEREAIAKMLEQTGWNRVRAAQRLGHQLSRASVPIKRPGSAASGRQQPGRPYEDHAYERLIAAVCPLWIAGADPDARGCGVRADADARRRRPRSARRLSDRSRGSAAHLGVEERRDEPVGARQAGRQDRAAAAQRRAGGRAHRPRAARRPDHEARDCPNPEVTVIVSIVRIKVSVIGEVARPVDTSSRAGRRPRRSCAWVHAIRVALEDRDPPSQGQVDGRFRSTTTRPRGSRRISP
jgi:hypothetical protein